MTFEGIQLQGAQKIMEKLNVSFSVHLFLNDIIVYSVILKILCNVMLFYFLTN